MKYAENEEGEKNGSDNLTAKVQSESDGMDQKPNLLNQTTENLGENVQTMQDPSVVSRGKNYY